MGGPTKTRIPCTGTSGNYLLDQIAIPLRDLGYSILGRGCDAYPDRGQASGTEYEGPLDDSSPARGWTSDAALLLSSVIGLWFATNTIAPPEPPSRLI
ncbi:MAG: hypothetical protein JO304_11955 [Solirubrobacterales bacterium]|nr:hypothetical protein [Solirubrobacterales bacterium]